MFQSIRFSDVFMVGSIYTFGTIWAYTISRSMPQLMQRLVIYHGVSHMFLFGGIVATSNIIYRRLTGYWDNGLRWKNPEDKLKKYDNTSVFHNSSLFWRSVRPSEQ